MLHIKVSDYRDLEHALKILKKKVRNTKLTDSIRERRYFVKAIVTGKHTYNFYLIQI